jgi:tetratricopeptide (TPR) repeat protein
MIFKTFKETRMRYLSVFIVAYLLCINVYAIETTASVTTSYKLNVDDAIGSELRIEVNKLAPLINAKKFTEAESLAIKIQKTYEEKFDHKLKQLCFQSQNDLNEYTKTNNQPFEWIDWGYKESIQMQAFIRAEYKDYSLALKLLDDVMAIAPLSAGAANEKGYIFNKLEKFEDALTAYQSAYDLSMKYESQRAFLATALRGKGYALGELRQFDKAEEAYKSSLLIEPSNKVALNELIYISKNNVLHINHLSNA